MNELVVIIPSKTAANLEACVEAVRNHGEDCRIIVVDDGVEWGAMRNGTAAAVDKMTGVKPFVFARNCNLGIRAAGDADVVLLNDDALLMSHGGLTLLQRTATRQPELGCIGAVTNVTGQPLQKPMRYGRRGLRIVHHIAFVCVLIPRRTINQIGLLDERYCIDYGVEDRDYCEMITRAGLQVAVHDGCYVDHAKLTSSFRGQPMAPGRSAQNRALFLEKFGLTNYFKFK